MVLVTGATGKTGRAVIAALAKRGVESRSFVRRATAVSPTTQIISGDMLNEADWERAMVGIDKVYHICPNMHEAEVEIGRLAINAAKKAEVGHFVYHSVLHPQVEAMPHHWRKLRVEEMLLASQRPFTILQPTAYMQNILGALSNILESGIYAMPYPVETRICLVDLADVAEVAALVLSEAGHEGATYELVGTPPLSQIDVARVLGDVYGRSIHAQAIPLEDWQQNAQSIGLSPYAIDTLLKMFRYYAAHGFIGNTTVLHTLLRRQPTSLAACM